MGYKWYKGVFRSEIEVAEIQHEETITAITIGGVVVGFFAFQSWFGSAWGLLGAFLGGWLAAAFATWILYLLMFSAVAFVIYGIIWVARH